MENARPLLAGPAGRGVKVICVLDPANVALAGESLDALLELGARNLSMNLNYEGAWDEAARARFVEGLAHLGERWVAAWRRGLDFSLNLFDSKVLTALKGGFSCADRCDFGCEELAVAPSGRLYPCDRLVGEDRREDVVIGDVWSGVDPVRRDALVAAKNALRAECAGCALRPRCMHWCGCVNHALTGEVGGVSGLLCYFEQAVADEVDRRSLQLLDEQNPAFIRRFLPSRRPRPAAGDARPAG